MDDLMAQEQEKYNLLWTHDDSYRERSPGMRFLEDALGLLNPAPGSSILDIGCGTGRTSKAMADKGYQVTALDISPHACKEFSGQMVVASVWDLPQIGPFDYGFCADVMEHIPPERVSEALSQISGVCGQVYFQIANFICHFGDEHGFHTHLTVENCHWWRQALEEHFQEVIIRPETKHHIAVCRS